MNTLMIYFVGWLFLVTPIDYLTSLSTGDPFLSVWAFCSAVYFVTCAIVAAVIAYR